MDDPALVVLAAGRGVRFGGDKQFSPLSTGRNVLFEYSVFDALQAGFRKVVFVLRESIRDEFETIAARFRDRIDVEVAMQDAMAYGGDTKARCAGLLGTGHALLAAAGSLDAPFAIVNADDFYGAGSYARAAEYLSASDGNRCAMLAYRLRNVLSPHGSVSRSICTPDSRGRLSSIVEHSRVRIDGDRIQSERNGAAEALDGSSLVSMNFWMMTPDLLPHVEAEFDRFLAQRAGTGSAEFLLPDCLGELARKGITEISCLPHDGRWFGMTYPADREHAMRAIADLHSNGAYPTPLWNGR